MAEQQKPVAPSKPIEPPKKMEFKLLGHNYVTPDLVAKVTGGRSTPKTSAPTAWCSSS